MLGFPISEETMMTEITMFSSETCRYCDLAESLLSRKGVLKIKKILVNHDDESIREMISKTGRRTTPQIFIGERHVGGFDDLVALDRDGSLDSLLAA